MMAGAAPEALYRGRFSLERIALFDPLGDAGIGGYTHELATALHRAGSFVHVFCPPHAFAARLQRPYVLTPGISGPELNLDARPAGQPLPDVQSGARDGVPALHAYLRVLRARETRARDDTPESESATRNAPGRLPHAALSATSTPMPGVQTTAVAPLTRKRRISALALARDLTDRGFDTVWSQWPTMPQIVSDLFRCAPHEGLATVHTVHNVEGHEADPSEASRLQSLYARADALIVHSAQARMMLGPLLHDGQQRIVESRHGTYSIYPRRPESRSAVRSALGIEPDETVLLCFGAVRPYKNIDAVIAALAVVGDLRVRVVVAGWEYGYAAAVPGDRLGRTRALTRHAGVHDRVHLLPGPFGIEQTAELFEASDIVMLPYRASSGSGVLCMALSFGTPVICSAVGGMGEYLPDERYGTILDGPTASAIAAAIRRRVERGAGVDDRSVPPQALRWDVIVRRLISELRAPAVERDPAVR